jgi:hypothetical protein
MTRLPVLWLAVAIVACAAPPSARATESPYVGPTSPGSPLVTTTPEPTPARTPDVVATPAIARNDLTAHIRVLRRGWRPAGRTLVVATIEGERVTFIAVPITPGGEAVPFLELTETSGWQLRLDGGALVAAFTNGSYTSSRIAIVDVSSGAARWVTPDDSDIYEVSPIWSPDGNRIYYSEQATGPVTYGDRGIFRISADGSNRVQVHGPDRNGGTLVRVTPDGQWLIWTRGQAGGSTDVLNLATGVNKTFEIAGSGGEIAWRTARPRALVMSHGCCAGLPTGRLLLWDDVTGATTELIAQDSPRFVFAGAADWDPAGTRIAASVRDRAELERSPRTVPTLVAIFDGTGGFRSVIPGLVGTVLAWFPEGILVMRGTADGMFELALGSESGDTSRVLYRTTATTQGYPATVTVSP